MRNKQQKGKRGIKRLAISMLVCAAMLTSMVTPAGALTDTSGVSVDDAVQLCDHIHGPECYAAPEGHICSEASGCVPVFPTKTITLPHVHDEDCFELVLVSGYEHSDACWEEQTTKICGMEVGDGEVVEYRSGYNHNEGCFDEEGALVCSQEETIGGTVIVTPGHIHTETCFETTLVLICDQDELPFVFGQGDLICGVYEGQEVEVEVTDYDAEPISWICGALERVCEHRYCVYGEPCLAVAPVAIAPLGSWVVDAQVANFTALQMEINNAPVGEQYVIEITDDFNITSAITISAGRDIVLVADENNPVALTTTGNHRHVTVSGALLTLTDGIALQGRSTGLVGGGVSVSSSGTLTMYGGEISGNTVIGTIWSVSGGGGVLVQENGTFTMHGGEISGNMAVNDHGGGVFVNNGTFTMTGGVIRDNTANCNGGDLFGGRGGNGNGGGVVVVDGTFEMDGGVIRNNTAANNGGGVAIADSTFEMNGNAVISGNAAHSGGGVAIGLANPELDYPPCQSYFVLVFSGGTFEMSGNAVIDGNTAQQGGGVAVGVVNPSGGSLTTQNVIFGRGTFEMSGNAAITDNKSLSLDRDFYNCGVSGFSSSSSGGGGVLVVDGEFTMNGGTISGNTANWRGGGVAICGMSVFGFWNVEEGNSRGTFTMNGGTISDNTAEEGGGGVSGSGGFERFAMSGGTIARNMAESGGGVFVLSGTFEMSGGTIGGNAAIGNFGSGSLAGNGGGVFSTAIEFTMTGTAVISGNTASGNGGGLVLRSRAFLFMPTMSGDAMIIGNTAGVNGGGVDIPGGRLEMSDGAIIVGNTAGVNGGGVHIDAGVWFDDVSAVTGGQGGLTMNDGEISDNTAGNHGGGVYLNNILFTLFTMNDGIIRNNTAEWGGGAWIPVELRDNAARVSILEPAIFYGNLALAGVFDYGHTDGVTNYSNIRWQDYNATPSQNSILGSHLLNNFDINNHVHNPDNLVVTFVGNGGTVYNANQHSFTVANGIVLSTGQIPALPNVARTGYTFLGWSEAAASGSPLVTDWRFAITQNRTFYAQWRPSGGGNGSNGGSGGGGGGGGTTVIEDNEVPLAEILSHFAYLIGYEDGTVRPRNNITRAEVSTIFFRFMSDGDRASHWIQTNPYSDVALAQWFNNAVSTTTNADMFIGFPDGTFRPNSAITRAELAAVIARMMGVTDSGAPLFNDIDGHWAQGYINAAAQNGWAVGYEGLGGRFLPNQPITRAEAAAMINRVFERLPEDPEDLLPGMLTWPDNANPNAWYYLYIQEATNSHTYVMKANGINETWEELIQTRPWVLLERPDSRPEDIFRI